MTTPTHPPHGALQAQGLRVDSYNLALVRADGDGFVGDLASQTAFRALLDEARSHQRTAKDPFGKTPTADVGKRAIDMVLVGGDADAAHLVHMAVEAHAQRLVEVTRCFLAQPEWQDVEAIVLGGGFPESHFGALAIRRADRLLRNARVKVRLRILDRDPDKAALLGWSSLLPEPVRRHDAFLAVDIGGTNIRCGLVEHRLEKAGEGQKARVLEHMQWRHADDAPARGEAIARLAGMLNGLNAQARTLGVDLAPFIGIAVPGKIEPDGKISQGAQNLPGDWEMPFDLPAALGAHLDRIGRRAPQVLLHNDAVVQGLSQRHAMRKHKRWGIFTIGTGLGNASYSRV
ncbi:ROK family protein [Stenotrophomonas sp. HITSZ_GD]|uniref:ROK family protein n=1 Tax=Stenotrophomonas sp. HITSZ_GD TaxID=3037248 RepID=UPI00240DF26A|nr:ROK family protein [Stenotrophomonas sp. HITSZ_GD]MDG2525569.1 ROK family protein [Stenotrophomonas sp. HITSZ_GD]